MSKHKQRLMLAVAAVAVWSGSAARADVTADALLKVLVRKGVLTQQEADDVRAEAEREAAAAPVAPAAPPALPSDTQALKDQIATVTSNLSRLQRTTVSGYIQARATFQKRAVPSSNFMVRRARLNFRNTSEYGRLAISIDGGQNQVTVNDAYYDWFATPTRGKSQGLVIRSGQFFRPFGYEVERVESEREFPERPAGWGVLFPGNRDVGFDFSHGLAPSTVLDFAVLNGNGTATPGTFKDTDNFKDLLGRVRYGLPSGAADFALSGYYGRQTAAATSTAPQVTGDRNRLGIAGNLYNLAGGTVRAEYIAARDLTTNLSTGPARVTGDEQAYYALYTHPVGEGYTVGFRYDAYDPDIHNDFRLDGDGEIKTFGVVGIKQVNENLKLSLAYELPRSTTYNKTTKTGQSQTNNLLTFQGQMRF